MTDHRINLTLYRLDAVMQGDLDEIVDALTADAQARHAGRDEPDERPLPQAMAAAASRLAGGWGA